MTVKYFTMKNWRGGRMYLSWTDSFTELAGDASLLAAGVPPQSVLTTEPVAGRFSSHFFSRILLFNKSAVGE
jgi:hypothetical protein